MGPEQCTLMAAFRAQPKVCLSTALVAGEVSVHEAVRRCPLGDVRHGSQTLAGLVNQSDCRKSINPGK